MASMPLTLGQLARAVGMTAEEVQSYWDRGLLQSPRRRVGRSGEAAYHKEHLERLLIIRKGMELGLSPEEVVRLVEPGPLLTCNDIYKIGMQRLERLREENNRPAAIKSLEALVDKCPRVGGRDACPVVAALHAGARRPKATFRRQK